MLPVAVNLNPAESATKLRDLPLTLKSPPTAKLSGRTTCGSQYLFSILPKRPPAFAFIKLISPTSVGPLPSGGLNLTKASPVTLPGESCINLNELASITTGK